MVGTHPYNKMTHEGFIGTADGSTKEPDHWDTVSKLKKIDQPIDNGTFELSLGQETSSQDREQRGLERTANKGLMSCGFSNALTYKSSTRERWQGNRHAISSRSRK